MAASRLRVAGGSARGVPLVEPRGVRLRPTSGLVREALFNILGAEVDGANVLDLFAGTGAAGIEALSRGAAHTTFVESEQACSQAILQSLARTGFAGRGTVVRGTLPRALQGIDGLFGIVFCDPPYGAAEAEETLIAVAALLAPAGVVVYEHSSRYNPPDRLADLFLVDRRHYGDSALSFYRRQEEAE
jgi:16S rRNA (guanine(966)-N(2))-methyltransferase RsmD